MQKQINQLISKRVGILKRLQESYRDSIKYDRKYLHLHVDSDFVFQEIVTVISISFKNRNQLF